MAQKRTCTQTNISHTTAMFGYVCILFVIKTYAYTFHCECACSSHRIFLRAKDTWTPERYPRLLLMHLAPLGPKVQKSCSIVGSPAFLRILLTCNDLHSPAQVPARFQLQQASHVIGIPRSRWCAARLRPVCGPRTRRNLLYVIGPRLGAKPALCRSGLYVQHDGAGDYQRLSNSNTSSALL